MMKKILTLLLLIPMLSFAQKDFRVIPGNKLYTITIKELDDIHVPDTLVENTVRQYVEYMDANPIDYESSMRKIIAIQMRDGDRDFVGNYKNGVIYLNWKLNEYPNTKRAAIIHYLAKVNGMKTKRTCIPHIISECFNMSDWTEEMFTKQFKRHSPYKYAVRQLKKRSPLKSKL